MKENRKEHTTCIHTCTNNTYMYVYTYVHVYVTCVHIITHIRTYVHVQVYTYNLYIHTYIHNYYTYFLSWPETREDKRILEWVPWHLWLTRRKTATRWWQRFGMSGQQCQNCHLTDNNMYTHVDCIYTNTYTDYVHYAYTCTCRDIILYSL